MEPSQPVQENIQQTPASSKFSIILLSSISLISLSGLFYFYQQNQQLKEQIALQASPTPTIPVKTIFQPTPIINEAGDWLSYSSPHNTIIQYPPDWKLEKKYINDSDGKAEVLFSFSLSKNEYSITVSFPSGYGPGVCIFKDQPEFTQELEPNPVSTKCEGDFVEIKNEISIFRRLAIPPKPLASGAPAEWGIYTKDQYGSYATIPPIAYKVPVNFDVNNVLVMDQILATLKPLK